MDIAQLAADTFLKNTGESLDLSQVIAAFKSLIGENAGDLDLAALVTQFQNGGLEDIVSSWLGDGGNALASKSQISDIPW